MRRRRSRAEAEQLVAEYEASGWTGVEFCRERGVALYVYNGGIKVPVDGEG